MAKHDKGVSARAYAVQQLDRIEVDGAYVGLAAGELDVEPMDAREERQATEYVAGVTRWRRWLDYLVAAFYRGDAARLQPTLRQILRVGLYDLLYLETPPHAALNEAVELAKQRLHPGAAGLVNGLLRSVLRRRDALPEPDRTDHAEYLGIRHSHPTWLVRRWLGRFGPAETEALLRWDNERPVYGLRVVKGTVEDLTRGLEALGVAWEPSPYLDAFVRVRALQPVIRAGWLAEGRAAVQDESAGLVVRLLDPQPGETLVDTCAAPGGKALYAAGRMQGEGRIVAVDLHEHRLQLVRHGARAQGVGNVETVAADLRAFAGDAGAPQADRVLLDAPCSGLGVLSKRADLRWNRSLEDLTELTTLQDALLDAAARLVRPGGLLVYSTCTIEPDENAARVEAFLSRHPGFALERADGYVPAALVTPEGYYATLPHRHHVDGAFGARLRRTA